MLSGIIENRALAFKNVYSKLAKLAKINIYIVL